MPSVEDFNVEKAELAGEPVTFTTYKIGSVFHCVIANVSPGANIARARAATRDEALDIAREKAERRLKG